MSALPPSQMAAMRDAASETLAPLVMLEARWEAIHVAAAEVARLAAISEEPQHTPLGQMLAVAEEAQSSVAARGIEDIEAMMRIGLVALTAVTARGQDASAPALALWREFHHAREAVLMTLEPYAEAA